MDNHIVPECYIDTMLVQTLVPPAKNKHYNHQKGCRNVSREMKVKSLKDSFAVGIVDKDKSEIDYLNEFKQIDNCENGLILYKHNSNLKHHYFIQICPAVEKWILNICADEKIDLADYTLPDTLNELKRITKSQNSIYDDRFLRLFSNLRSSTNLQINKLIHWITLLKEKNYQVDINELING